MVTQKSIVVKTKHFWLLRWLLKKVSVVKTKQFWLTRWLLKKVSWLKQNSFGWFGGYSKKYRGWNKTVLVDSVVTQKSIVVETKQFWLIRWLLKKVSWLKQNSFGWFGGYSKKYRGWNKTVLVDSVVTQKSILVETKHFWLIWWLLKKVSVVKTKQFWLIRWLLKKVSVVKTKHFWLIWWLLKKVSVVKTKHFWLIWLLLKKVSVVETKHFWLIRWLLKKVSWLKQNTFGWFGGYSKNYRG